MVNLTAHALLNGISLTFQRQLWPEKKPIIRSEFERTGMFPLSKTNTIQQRMGCLVYHEKTQTSERSL